MKILVFSDSHGTTEKMEGAVRGFNPDHILHLGDVVRDAQRLHQTFPHIPMTHVAGNCDGYNSSAPAEALVHLEGCAILLFHGHNHQVKLSPYRAVLDAKSRGVQVLLFGHTHVPVCFQEEALWVMNPGSVGDFTAPSCGLITIEDGQVVCRLIKP